MNCFYGLGEGPCGPVCLKGPGKKPALTVLKEKCVVLKTIFMEYVVKD